MFSLLGLVAATATTALGAFSEGLTVSIVAYSAVKGAAKSNISLKK